MKDLIIDNDLRRMSSIDDFSKFENSTMITVPSELKKVIFKYEGSTVKQNVFFNEEEGLFFSVSQFLFLYKSPEGGASIEAIYEGHLQEGNKDFIPFANDGGGWDYNFSINEKTYGQIWLNEFSGGDEDPYRFIASSLAVFINGLMTEDDAVKKGY